MSRKQPKTTKSPTLRFPEFTGEWEEKRFHDVFQFGKTNSFSREMLNYRSGEVFNLHYGDIHTKFHSHFRMENERVPFVNSGFNTNTNDLVEVGDLVLADASEDYNDIGKTIEIVSTGGKKIVSGLHTILCKRNYSGLATGFMGHLLQTESQKLKIKKISQGIKVLGLSKRYLGETEFSLPSTQEQHKIASFLTTVDDWIENLKKQKESLEEYKKGMLQKLFSQEIRFKDGNGQDYPEWEEKRLGEVCEYKNGNSFEMNVVDNGKYKLITLNSIDIDGNIKKEHKTVNYADWYLEKNDLVMVLSDVAHGDFLGLVDIIPENNKFVLNQRMGLLRKKSQSTDLRFLKFFINFNQRYFKLHGQGSSQQNLSKGDIEKFIITTPVLNEQNKITSFLSSIDDLINLSNQRITLAEEWKKGLMQGMFV